jgi:hypothetical protein
VRSVDHGGQNRGSHGDAYRGQERVAMGLDKWHGEPFYRCASPRAKQGVGADRCTGAWSALRQGPMTHESGR